MAADLWLPHVVHNDDVVGLQHRDELLLDISAEALAVDRASKTQGAASRSQRRAPVAVRSQTAQVHALRPQPSSVAMLVLIQNGNHGDDCQYRASWEG